MPTVAVITPFYKEDNDTLKKCIDSVRAQTVPCRHYLIADEFGREWLDYDKRVHKQIILSGPHHDYGNTPRAVGALLAVSEGADAICFLDADNTYDPDHIETCLATATPDLDYVVARRRILLPDGTFVTEKEEPGHVDTNCFFLLPGAFCAIAGKALLPKQLAIDGDRFFAKRLNFLRSEATSKPTVNYVSNWAVHHKVVGRFPPAGAKHPHDSKPIIAWWDALSDRERSIVFRNLGYDFKFT